MELPILKPHTRQGIHKQNNKQDDIMKKKKDFLIQLFNFLTLRFNLDKSLH